MIFEEIRVEFVYFHKNRWSWKIEIFHYPLPSNEIIPPIHFCQSSPNFFPNWPGSCFKNSLEERHQFSFDLISGEEIIGCIPPRIFYSRRGREKKGGFKVARVAISAMPDQGGVVIRLGEGDGGGVGTRFGGGRYHRPSKRHREPLHNQIFKSAQIAFWFSIDPRFYHRGSFHSPFSIFFICNGDWERWVEHLTGIK